MPILSDPNLLHFTSSVQIDKVLSVHEGSFFVAAPSPFPPTTGLSTFPTNIPESTFFYGVYSIDGGTTWNDFNSSVVVISSGSPVFQTCDVWGESEVDVFTVRAQNWYNHVSGVGTARTVLYKVALIAKPEQTVVPSGNTNEVLQFSSKYNYQKIAVDDYFNTTIASNVRPIFDVKHNLGYVPKIRVFVSEGGEITDAGRSFALDAYSAIQIDSTKVRHVISNENNPNSRSIRVYTRIYYDE